MYAYLLPIHSWLRWAVVVALLWVLVRGAAGVLAGARFTRPDDFFRSLLSGASHAQLLVGMVLYIQSPVLAVFRANLAAGMRNPALWFFGVLHISCMVAAVVLITVGTAKARRLDAPRDKHRALLLWCGTAAVLIFAAVPWPGHPLVERPLIRPL